MTENHMYGPEVAEIIEGKNYTCEASYQAGIIEGMRLADLQSIGLVLQPFPEYRNYAPMKVLQELVGFDVQAWIDGGKP